jgi:hypothetical protein
MTLNSGNAETQEIILNENEIQVSEQPEIPVPDTQQRARSESTRGIIFKLSKLNKRTNGLCLD